MSLPLLAAGTLAPGTGSSEFTGACVPAISQIQPTVAFIGDEITISGSCFGNLTRKEIVFGPGALQVLTWSDDSITALVGPSAVSGDVTIQNGFGSTDSRFLSVHNYTLPPAGSDIAHGVVKVRIATSFEANEVAEDSGLATLDRVFKTEDPVLSRWWYLSTPKGLEVETMRGLAEHPGVEWVHVITQDELKAGFTPNDACFDTIDDSGCPVAARQWSPQKISAPAAWDVTQGSSSIDIAIIDSGIVAHTDLTATGTGSDGCAFSHGTHVAGIAAATTNNGAGVAGIGWNSHLRSYPVLSGPNCTVSSHAALAQAIHDAAEDGSEVINLSIWGAAFNQDVADAIEDAWEDGATVVSIAGNDGLGFPTYPANYNHVIAVGATDQSDARGVFPLGGSSRHGSWLDISAPGVDILSTVASGYTVASGTSMAAPHVSGVAALLASMGLDNCGIVETLLHPNSVDPISWDGGEGRLNAYKAVTNVQDSDGDGMGNSCDNCPTVSNPGQQNSDGDALGNACDNCPTVTNQNQADSDADGVGNVCDNCPSVSNSGQQNSDGDTLGNACDNCPTVTNQNQINSDGDTFGDACDNCPTVTNQSQGDSDSDDVGDVCDNCPLWPNASQALPPWQVPSRDDDCDGFDLARETWVGTDPGLQCTVFENDDPSPNWPADLRSNKEINIGDVLALKPVFGSTFTPETDPEKRSPVQRFDLLPNYGGSTSSINIGDVLALKPVFATSCTAGEGLAPPGGGGDSPESGFGSGITVAVDADPGETPANTATSLGTREECVSAEVSGTVTIDVTVDAVPELDEESGGLTGFQFKLTYDPAKLKVTASNHAMLLSANGGSLVPFSDAVPDTDGAFTVAVADFSTTTPEDGAGVLARVTLEVLAEGTAWLGLQDVALVGSDGSEYEVGDILGGCVEVGET